jgi:hypothetical protein
MVSIFISFYKSINTFYSLYNTNTLFTLPTYAALNSDDTPLFVLEPNSVTFESLLHKKAQTNYFSIDPSLYKEEISPLALKYVSFSLFFIKSRWLIHG